MSAYNHSDRIPVVSWQVGERFIKASFTAMASDCFVLCDRISLLEAQPVVEAIVAEVARFEATYSRFRSDSLLSWIHGQGGRRVRIPDAACDLFDYADTCYQISSGLFDVTAGVLRRIWDFSQPHPIPSDEAIHNLLAYVGWHKITWDRPYLTLPNGMEIDFGGFGKEFAVDQAIATARSLTTASVLVNFGGDLAISGPRADGDGWIVGGEDQVHAANYTGTAPSWRVRQGAVATSGITRRFLWHDGKRYGHILNPHTGWPVESPPLSVSVAAPTASEAGLLATLAILHGADAEAFLAEQGVHYHCVPAVALSSP